VTVFTNGCFDILHAGHIRLLEYCRSIGNRVVVGINSDDSVRRLKGYDRPINTQDDRRELLMALRSVDEVIVFEEDTPIELIRSLQPDIIVKGGDYTPDQVVGFDLAEVRIFNFVDGKSTTATIERAALGRRLH
jgi:D-beta-D-heptose 7-phosphate kinase / D-beta-D-heptose 1-phosphate adenosyltransferase